MWNCLWAHALKRSPGINRKSRVWYPVPGLLSSATWRSLPKKRFNGLTNQSSTGRRHTLQACSHDILLEPGKQTMARDRDKTQVKLTEIFRAAYISSAV